MELTSQKMRRLAPELDPLRLGTGWTPDELSKPQIIVESTFGDSHPGSGHLDKLVNAACKGAAEAGGHGARYFATDICDGESQGTDGINFSLASREEGAHFPSLRSFRFISIRFSNCSFPKRFPNRELLNGGLTTLPVSSVAE